MSAPAGMAPAAAPATLEVDNLASHYFTKAGEVKAVDGVSLSIAPAEVLGLVGESGCGKTTIGLSILGLIDPPGRIVSGAIRFKGRDLVELGDEQLRRLRGSRIAMIFQDPMMTLNPVLRIDTQLIEAILAHRKLDRRSARALAQDALADAGIANPGRCLQAYPHELSGGMRQRIVIAIAFINEPDLVIADEPTTSLDANLQVQILRLASKLCRRKGTAMIWITHNLAVVSSLAHRIAVMYAGRIVEQGPAHEVLSRPLHPYTRGLVGSVPSAKAGKTRLESIPGMVPSLLNLPTGCHFRPRCSRAAPACSDVPDVSQPVAGRDVRCWHPLLP
jgi:peptide/nickel transport system ATP-binding protein